MEKLNMTANNNGGNLTAAAMHRRRQHRYRDQLDERSIDRSVKKRRQANEVERILPDESSYETSENGEEDEFSVKLLKSCSSAYHRYESPSRTANLKTDVIIGVHVPRKARSAMKRSCGSWVSGGGVREERSGRQLSASPSRFSPAPISNGPGPGRKRLKTSSGGKLRPPKSGKTPAASLVEDELEVAEVLFGLTRQFESEGQKVVDDVRNESKHEAVSSENLPVRVNYSDVRSVNSTPVTAIAPKRKRPRKIDDESPASSVGVNSFPGASSAAKVEKENQIEPTSLLQSEKKDESSNKTEVVVSSNLSTPMNEDMKSLESAEKAADMKSLAVKSERLEVKGEAVYDVKENTCSSLGTSIAEEATTKSLAVKDKSSEAKFTFDLMAPPSEKVSNDDENDLCSHQRDQKDAASVVKIEVEKKDKEKLDEALAEREVDKSLEESDSKSQKGSEINNKLQFDLERADEDNIDSNKIHAQKQQKVLDFESTKQDKSVQHASSSTPLIVAGWQGSFPPFGYNGQIPPAQVVLPIDASSGSPILHPSSFLSPRSRPKRCATHCYIAQQIQYHQRLARANPIWSAATAAAAAAGAIPLIGAKQLGQNGVLPSDGAILGNPVQGNFLAINACSSKDNHEPSSAMAANKPSKEISNAGYAITEGNDKKQSAVPPPSVPGPNMLHGQTFVFPVNQQQAVGSMAAAVPRTSKFTPPNGNSAPAASPTSSVNFSFAGLAPSETQYLTLVQNGGYSFPIPASVAATSPQYKGLTPAGTIPIFNTPFYSSQVLHPSQIQQQHATASQPVLPLQAYQHVNKSIGSSSSNKHSPLPQQAPGAGATANAGTSHGPADNEKGSSSNQAQKNPYDQKYAMPISAQSLTLLPNANLSAAGSGAGGAQTDKPSWNQNQPQSQQKQSGRVELPSSQVFSVPFTSFNGMSPGLDFSSVPQNGFLLQNLPESFRQQYGHMNIQASPATAYLAQQKTQNHNTDESALVSKESRIAVGKSEEDSRKAPSTSNKTLSSSPHTLNFSRTDESVVSSILNNNAMDNSSRTLNLMASHSGSNTAVTTNDAMDNSSRTLNLMAGHSGSSTAVTTAGATSTMNMPCSQQQLNQFQKHQQKQLLMHNQYPSSRTKIPSSNNSPVMYTERLPANLPGTKFPQPLAGFPQTVVQGGNGGSNSTQSPQWRANARAAPASQANVSSQSAMKNNAVHQGRAVQQPLPSQSHQNHQNLISFGANLMKVVPAGLQQHSMPTSSQSSTAVISPPQNSGIKGSPNTTQTSSSGKPASSASVLSFPQSSSPKISSNSSQISSSIPPGSRELAAATSQTNVLTNNSGTKLQHQLLQQLPPQSQKSQQHSQAQIYFTNGFMQQTQHPAQPNPAHAVAGRFYHARPPEQSQQQNSSSGCSTAVTESTAAVSANSSNGLPSPGLMQAAQLAVAARASSLVPATFPYMSAPTVSVKPTKD